MSSPAAPDDAKAGQNQAQDLDSMTSALVAGAKRAAPRGSGGSTHKRMPGLLVYERVYYGSPRWESSEQDDRRPHTRKVFEKGPKADANREPEVVSLINEAWDAEGALKQRLRAEEGPPTQRIELLTCVNPRCTRRSQWVTSAAIAKYRAALQETFRQVGSPQDKRGAILTPKCGTCGKNLVSMLIQPLRAKWLYVLGGAGEALKLEQEIRVDDQGLWHWGKNAALTPRDARQDFADGEPVISTPREGHRLQFFVSPVQLSQGALGRLLEYAALHEGWAPESRTLEQTDGCTVRREFHALADSTLQREYVAVLDPFGFAQEAYAWDYVPMVSAWFGFSLDVRENNKKQIATLLMALAAHGDTFDLIGQMNGNKDRWQIHGARHQAQAWLKRHEDCREFLRMKLNDAGERLVRLLDSAAHDVVEMACVEELSDAHASLMPLSLGVWHLAVVLQHMLACKSGADYMGRMRQDDRRIPKRFIIDQTALDAATKERLIRETGGMAATLLHWFSPVIASDEPLYGEAGWLQPKFAALGVPLVLAFEEESKIKSALKVDSKAMETIKRANDYRKQVLMASAAAEGVLKDGAEPEIRQHFLPKRLFESNLWKVNVLLTDIVDVVDAIVEAREALAKTDPEFADRVSAVAKVSKTGLTSAAFAADWGGKLIKHYAKVKYKVDLSRELGAGTPATALKKSFDALEKAGKVATGLISILSAIEYLSDRNVLKTIKGGDAKNIAGTAMEWYGGGLGAAGGILALMPAAMELGTLASLAGIVGLGIAIVGALILWLFSDDRTPLQLYTAHCLFGDDYGGGDEDDTPKWSAHAFPDWAQGSRRYGNQLVTLMRLLSGFKVVVNSRLHENQNSYFERVGYTFDDMLSQGEIHMKEKLPMMPAHYGGYVMLGNPLTNSKLEVFVEGEYRRTDDPQDVLRPRTYARIDLRTGTAEIFTPSAGEQSAANGDRGIYVNAKVVVSLVPNTATWGMSEMQWVRVRMQQDIPSGYQAPLPAKARWEFGARLDVSGQQHYLPLGRRFVRVVGNAAASADPIPRNSYDS
ncbi:MAG: hypothetical protein U1D55_02800 [Phycisphaerae bacterium]